MEQTPDQESVSNNLNQPESRPWDIRNGFSGWFMGLGWAVGSFVSFQVVAGIVAIVLLVVLGRVSLDSFSEQAIFENLDILFIGNTIGQIIFLGLFTWFITRLSASKENRKEFLRLSTPPNLSRNLILAFVLLIVIQPVIYWLSWLNMQFPFSETYLKFEVDQLRLIENFLRSDHLLMLTVFHIAVVPAFCEELLFRGYILRNFQRSMVPWAAILLSGIIFGLFHVRFTQFIPLATLGVLLAWLTITTRSIWPAVIAHFVNNAGSVIFASLYPEIAFDETMKDTMPPVYLVFSGIILTGFLLYYIQKVNYESKRSESYVQRFKSG